MAVLPDSEDPHPAHPPLIRLSSAACTGKGFVRRNAEAGVVTVPPAGCIGTPKDIEHAPGGGRLNARPSVFGPQHASPRVEIEGDKHDTEEPTVSGPAAPVFDVDGDVAAGLALVGLTEDLGQLGPARLRALLSEARGERSTDA